MLTQENLILSRTATDGNGGMQFLYKINQYGISATNRPQEDISQIHWEVDVIKYHTGDAIKFDACHSTELADKSLKFYSDKALNEFLEKAFDYFRELKVLESMLPEEKGS
ncbi:MAG: hypothetical protein IID46_10295 [Planctomycetes bacterium]|nr:hypothetical protein [Planctomycetota bacterium]